jgi:hypothetical protein
VRTSGCCGVTVGLHSGSVPVTGATSSSQRISSSGCPAVTSAPSATSSRRTVTVLHLPRVTGTVGEDRSTVGATGTAAVSSPPPPPRKARTTSAAAMTAHTRRRRTGRTTVRTADMHAPRALGHSPVAVGGTLAAPDGTAGGAPSGAPPSLRWAPRVCGGSQIGAEGRRDESLPNTQCRS